MVYLLRGSHGAIYLDLNISLFALRDQTDFRIGAR